MTHLYAMSDIHGCQDAFMERVAHLTALGFFEEGCADELVLLGDYVDRGPDSLGVVREVMRLERECPGRVFPLMGNHEDEFLRWLGEGAADWDDDVLLDDGLDELLGMLAPDFGPASGHAPIDRLRMWRMTDPNGATMRSLLDPAEFSKLEDAVALNDAHAADAFERACGRIRAKYPREVSWMRGLKLTRTTRRQVFVHAGIDESQGAEWDIVTPRDTLLCSRETPRGRFLLDVVSGHTAASTVAGDPSLEGVFWDGESHFYIDGMTIATGRIPVLVYDADEDSYRELDADGEPREIAAPGEGSAR